MNDLNMTGSSMNAGTIFSRNKAENVRPKTENKLNFNSTSAVSSMRTASLSRSGNKGGRKSILKIPGSDLNQTLNSTVIA